MEKSKIQVTAQRTTSIWSVPRVTSGVVAHLFGVGRWVGGWVVWRKDEERKEGRKEGALCHFSFPLTYQSLYQFITGLPCGAAGAPPPALLMGPPCIAWFRWGCVQNGMGMKVGWVGG